MKLTKKVRRQNETLTLLLFWEPFLIALLIQVLHMPSFVKYVFDAIWLFLLLTITVIKKHNQYSKLYIKIIFLLFLYTFVIYIAKYQSLLYYIWGFRNNFRFFVFFIACILYLDRDDLYEGTKWLDKLFYLNIVVLCYQFFALGYKQDLLGGIFGTEFGCNGYLNLFLDLMLVKNYIYYQNKKTKLLTFIFNLVLMLAIAAMAELKFFFIEFVVILLIATLFTDFSWRKLVIIIGAVVAFVVGYRAIMHIFPDTDLSMEYLFNYAATERGYTNSKDLNRLTFYPIINRLFLRDIPAQLFGLGLGNCDYATGIPFLTTPFFQENENMHYYWMSSSFMYLELGLIGAALYLLFFIVCMFKSFRVSKVAKDDEKIFSQISFLAGVTIILCLFYNISMRIEAAYMAYFFLAMPWIYKNGFSQENRNVVQ